MLLTLGACARGTVVVLSVIGFFTQVHYVDFAAESASFKRFGVIY